MDIRIFCGKCSRQIGEDDHYCIFCGEAVKKKNGISSKQIQEKRDNSLMDNDEVTIIQNLEDAKTDIEKAEEFKKQGKYEEAITLYSTHLSFHPENSDAWANKGFSLSVLGKHNEAIECFDKALELTPSLPQLILLNKGNTLINLQEYKEAILNFNSALDKDRKLVYAWNAKAIAYNSLNMPERALKCCEESLKIEPESAEILFHKARALKMLDKHEEARECEKKAKEIDPSIMKIL